MNRVVFTYLVKFLLVAIFLLRHIDAFSQSSFVDCTAKINNAEKLFNDGFFEDCAGSVNKILSECDLNRKEREHALELLTKAYAEIPDEGRANGAAEALLKKFPHYELSENQNYESFNRLIKKYRIHPALSLGIRNVILWTGFNTTKFFSLPDGSINSDPYRAGNYFFSYYGWAEFEFDRDISLNGDLMWWTSYYYSDFTHGEDLFIHYSEWPEFLELPVYVKKYFTIGRNLKPYVTSGIGWLFMVKSVSNVSKTNTTENMTYYNNGIDVTGMRNRNNLEWIAGAGLGYRIKNVGLYLDLRYYLGLTSLTDPDQRMQNQMLQDEYFYVDNSLKMNKFEMGASISYTFINSVKKVR